MAEESKNDKGDIVAKVPTPSSDSKLKDEKKKKKKGLFSRVWNSVFRSQGDDFEKRLQHITKEEAAVLSRMKRRSQTSRRMIRNFVVLSVLFEVIAVGYAIMTTRALLLDWRMRALRVLPMFLFPGLSFLIYWAFSSTTKMFDRKDQKTLERLRTERQNKIDELKEKTNYYITQQLIQRYDPDPAAKAAAASVLASKLGSDSGLKVYLGDESRPTGPTGRSSDVEVVPPGGLRNRKQSQTRGTRTDNLVPDYHEDDVLHQAGPDGFDTLDQHLVVDHQEQPGFSAKDGGWLARMAALLVGEDPTQSYALICGNCHMHNGLARKEDFPYVTYYCPHCSALNRPKQTEDHAGSLSPHMSSLTPTISDVEVMENAGGSTVDRTTAPVSSITPAAPVTPVTPAAPVTPVTPAAPVTPVTPAAPVTPVDIETRTPETIEATSDGLAG